MIKANTAIIHVWIYFFIIQFWWIFCKICYTHKEEFDLINSVFYVSLFVSPFVVGWAAVTKRWSWRDTRERGAASLSLTSISVVFIMSHTKALLVPTFRCTPLSLHFYTQTCNTAFPGKWERLNTRARYVCTSTHTYIHNVTCQKDGWPN